MREMTFESCMSPDSLVRSSMTSLLWEEVEGPGVAILEGLNSRSGCL